MKPDKSNSLANKICNVSCATNGVSLAEPIGSPVLEFHVSTPSQSVLIIAARLIYKKLEYNRLVDMKKEAFMPKGVIYAAYR
jgi:hypothetical protein